MSILVRLWRLGDEMHSLPTKRAKRILRCATDAAKEIDRLERENAALRKDQERLDWLTNSLGWVIVGYPEADPSDHATEDNTLADAWRAAIDAARAKKAKP
jgi:hypothetical protein